MFIKKLLTGDDGKGIAEAEIGEATPKYCIVHLCTGSDILVAN